MVRLRVWRSVASSVDRIPDCDDPGRRASGAVCRTLPRSPACGSSPLPLERSSRWFNRGGHVPLYVGTVMDALPPPWLLAMWAQFATTFRYSLRTVITRPSTRRVVWRSRRPNRIPRGRTSRRCHPAASVDARPAPPLNQLGHRPGRLLCRRATGDAGTGRGLPDDGESDPRIGPASVASARSQARPMSRWAQATHIRVRFA